MAYYPPGVRLTATDCSAPMVEVCKRKADEAGYAPVAFLVKENETLEKHENVANLPRVLADARVADSFDAVVDTFGLCSFEDPVAALREMSRVCRKGSTKKKKKNARGAVDDESVKPGKIYLLEHGRSDWAWLSNILDRHADPHAKRWGCYWNRDILAIVREAGLEIESVARYHLGTTYVIVAAPPRRRR